MNDVIILSSVYYLCLLVSYVPFQHIAIASVQNFEGGNIDIVIHPIKVSHSTTLH